MKAASPPEIPALTVAATDWLMESGLAGSDLPDLVAGLSGQLNRGGMSVERAGCAVLTLHPQIVSQEVTWEAANNRAATTYYTPKLMEAPENRRSPYFELAVNRITYKRYVLSGRPFSDMSLLARLQAEGYTEYFGFFHATGGAAAITPSARRAGLVPCVVGSFATRREGGFTKGEIRCFKIVSKTLALATKARANFETGARLLDIYLGRACSAQILDGRIMRGDCERIPCGIFFCDLRQSSRLVTQLTLDDYIALLNRYFDVAAGAVMAEGGEILKFIGDAILGIFRSDTPGRDIAMREHALAASLTTLRGIHTLDARGLPLGVGISLHVGEVMYGNVGTDERLDFTVIGRAVHEAARMQDLTKQLGHSVLASAPFVEPIRDRFAFAGAHPVAGFDELLEAYIPQI
jgi:adenylate cyclase